MTQFVDGMYPKMVSQWTRTKMEAMVAADFFVGGYPAFGFLKVIATEAVGFHKGDKDPPKRLVPHPDHAPMVRRAFDLFLETHSQARVCDYLNSVTDRRWTHTTTKGLLKNEVYKGVLHFGQWRNEGAWEPLVAAETWEAVHESLGIQGGRPARPQTADDYTYDLRGRVLCPHCGCGFAQASHPGKTKRVHYYVCQKANRREACPIGRVNADRLHATVLHFMNHAAKHRTVMHRLIAASGGWGSA